MGEGVVKSQGRPWATPGHERPRATGLGQPAALVYNAAGQGERRKVPAVLLPGPWCGNRKAVRFSRPGGLSLFGWGFALAPVVFHDTRIPQVNVLLCPVFSRWPIFFCAYLWCLPLLKLLY